MLVVLVEDREAVALGAESARGLANLGVTRVAVLEGEDSLALAIEGWAFDPSRSSYQAPRLVAPGAERPRTLHQVAEVSVTPWVDEGRVVSD